MTSPNEWWKEEPFCNWRKFPSARTVQVREGEQGNQEVQDDFDIPAIIEEVKRREDERFNRLMKVNLRAIEIMREKKNDAFVGGAIGMCADLLENLMKENNL